jgi:hypothetical protein
MVAPEVGPRKLDVVEFQRIPGQPLDGDPGARRPEPRRWLCSCRPGRGPNRRSSFSFSSNAMKSELRLVCEVRTINSRLAASSAPIIATLHDWPGAVRQSYRFVSVEQHDATRSRLGFGASAGAT